MQYKLCIIEIDFILWTLNVSQTFPGTRSYYADYVGNGLCIWTIRHSSRLWVRTYSQKITNGDVLLQLVKIYKINSSDLKINLDIYGMTQPTLY